MNKQLQKILDALQKKKNLSAKDKTTLLKSLKDVDHEITAKNRELEIEAALEKVRARTMAMQSSEELQEASNLMFLEIQALGINAWSCGYNILNKDKTKSTCWMSSEGELQDPFPLKFTEEASFIEMFEFLNSKDTFMVQELKDKGIEQHYAYMKSVPDLKETFKNIEDAGLSLPSYQINHLCKFTKGFLLFITYEPVPDAHDIFKRFTYVFEQTYTRFLDLQKAESQAREAEIELALERVRSRAMAMHISEELLDVVPLLFEGLNKLKIALTSGAAVGINIYLPDAEKNNVYVCGDSDLGLVTQNFVHPYSKDKVTKDLFNCRKQQMEVFVEKYSKTEKDNFYKHLFKNSELGDLPKEVKTQILETNLLTMTVVPTEYFMINVVDLEGKVLSQDDVNILKRFSSVFNQAYTRFLDLQKAEAHNRELEIEAALEKVRSRSLAMHNSEELKEAATELYNQILNLGFEKVDSAGFIFPLPEENIQKCWFFETDSFLFSVFEIPYQGDLVLQERIEASNKGIPYLEQILTGKKLQNHMGIVMPESLRSLALEGAIEAMPSLTIFNMAFFKNGYINLISHDKLSKAEQSILIRFAKVFEQTYTRFLDLQKAEEQAREAQIEVALERVRSRSMAMHKSEELSEAAELLYLQLKELGIDPWTSGYVFVEEEKNEARVWMVEPNGKFFWGLWSVPLGEEKVLKERYESWKRKEKIHRKFLMGQENIDHHRYIVEHSPLIKSETKDFLSALPVELMITSLHFSHGYLIVISESLLSEDEEKILLRFTQVFEMTYRRFLDLQKAEAQAREAQIEAALERVRSRSMAMHHSNELGQVASALFNQIEDICQIKLRRSLIHIIDEPQNKIDIWYTDITGADSEIKNFSMPMEGHIVSKTATRAWKKNKNVVVEVNSHQMKSFVEHIVAYGFKFVKKEKPVDSLFLNFSPFSHGQLNIVSYESIDESNFLLFNRFAKVFEQTYTRFLDLQKAEAQTREAQIETSLERVRSRTMAMHTSEDVGNTMAVLFDEIVSLGIKAERNGILIMHEKNPAELWTAKPNAKNKIELISWNLDMTLHNMTKGLFDSWNSKEPSFSYHLFGEDQKIYYKALNNSTDYPIKFDLNSLPDNEWGYCFNFKEGCIYIFTQEKMPEEYTKILNRFASLFGQTYQRYQDLQKAEEQTRESQIELGLERVRARAMAMQTSDELSDLVNTVFLELTKLDFALSWCIINIINESSKSNMVWGANPEIGKEPESYFMKFEDHRFHHEMMKAYQERKSKWVYTVKGKEKRNYEAYLFNETEFKRVPKDVQDKMRSTKQYVASFTFSNFGGLQTIGEEPLSAENLEILNRFGKVFNLTYTRFNDLQKAEAQAKEAQIEASLERVRARAMAMHNPDELTDVLGVLFDQFDLLAINPTFTHLTLFDKKNETFSFRMTTTGENRVVAEQHIDINAVDAWKDSYMKWQKSEPNTINCIDYTPNELPFIWDLLSEVTNALPEGNKIYPKDFRDGLYTTQGHFEYGYIGFNHKRRATKEEKAIVVRFAKEFGRTYQRFLDLQKAEAQAKEAQIEAALERVRSKAMAMHKTDELPEVGGLLYQELKKLGIESVSSGFGLIDEEKKMVWYYMANPEDGSIMYDPIGTPYSLTKPMRAMTSSWKKQQPYQVLELNPKETIEHQTFIAEKSIGFSYSAAELLSFTPERLVLHSFNFPEGYLLIVGGAKLSDLQLDMMLRFTKVFKMTYRRFLDLKKAEAQAREAQIEAALERVRSKSMAMHNSEDVGDTVITLFYEVLNLGLDQSIRCGIGILEGFKGMQTWSATLNSNSEVDLKLGMLNMTIHPLLKGVKTWWKKGKSGFTYELIGNEVIKYYKALNDEPDYSFHTDLNSLPEKIFHNSFIFTEGILFSFTSNPLSKEAVGVLKRFTAVFEQTYTRFLDLQKAEVQAKESQIQLAMERVRARTMAMQHSDELTEASNLLFQQMQSLDISTFSAGFCIWEDDKKAANFWMSSEGNLQPPFKAPLTENSIFIRYKKGHERGKTFFVEEFKGEELAEHYRYIITLPDVKKMMEKFEEKGAPGPSFPNTQVNHVVYFTQGFLLFVTYYPLPEVHDIFKRFGLVFEQTYTRFQDLKKAEAQAREAQIEASLEKVRSRTMGMHKSDELTDVATVLFKEVKSLGIEQWTCGFNIWKSGDTEFTFYPGSTDGMVLTPSTVPLSEAPVFRRFDESRNRGDELLIYEMKGKEQKEHYKYMLAHPGGLGKTLQNMLDAGHQFPIFQIDHLANFSHGNLLFITFEHVPEMHDVFKRFAKVFEQTYTRFLDLKKAEAQAREAKIEAALEKVRSRSLAMQKSEELSKVIKVISQQLIDLNIKFSNVSFGFDSDDSDYTFWSSISGETEPIKINVPHIDHPITDRISIARKNKDKFFTDHFSAEIHGTYMKHIIHNSHLRSMPKNQIEKLINSPIARSVALLPNIFLVLANYKGIPYSEGVNAIVARFAQVFEQSYRRFLDLKKAESQAREARIETALERIRSRTMAMHKSDELTDVAGLLFQQVSDLGIDTWTTGFNIWSEDNNFYEDYITSPKGSFVQPYLVDTRKASVLQEVSVARKRGDTFFEQLAEGKELKEMYIELSKFGDQEQFDKILEDGIKFPESQVHHFVFGSKVSVMFITFKPVPEAHDIFIRFGKVFEQTYTRFLDLQKAEAQMREAQIEAALERVRSRSMAMQHSTELNLVLKTVFEELVTLEFELERCVIWTYNEKDRSVRWWAANPEADSGTESYLITNQDHPVYHEYWKAWEERRSKYLYILEGENKESWVNILFTKTEMSGLPDEVKIGMIRPEKVYLYNTFNDFGVLFAVAVEPISDDNFSIIERFGNVFNQSYTRFKDIQKAEIRAKEALKQSSLDRLRAKIASMRTATDLEQIIPSVWNELNILGVPFIRCGVFITNEENQSISTYLSAPDGQALAAIELPYDINKVTVNIVLNWKKNEIYQTSWSKKEFLAFMKDLVDQGLLKDPDLYQGTAPPDILFLNFVPFKQGMLYVGNIETLSTEHVELVQALTKAFSIAYARYEDFNQLEEAKKSVDHTLTELKSAQSQLVQSEKMASLGELTAGIAHEIQNPLNFVNNFSEVSEELLEELEEEIANNSKEDIAAILNDIKQNLNKINHHGKRASGIVKGMLDHSRTSSGERVLTDINVLADEYLRLAYHGLRAKDRTFTADFKAELDKTIPKISIVAQDFGRVILNLINNAFYAVSEKRKESDDTYEPKVTVATKKMEDTIQISVKDNGNGIPKELVDKIFQPFFTTKPTGQGTGLGLSLSYDIVKAHGGDIEVESDPGAGTTFKISLNSKS